MRKTLHPVILSVLLFLLGGTVFAQEKLSIDKVYSAVLKNSGTIVEDDQIKGYYFLYQSDKVDKKTNEYTLQILDANLNKLKDIKFQDSKDISLMEAAFNGSSLVFMFYDKDQKMLDYRLYDMSGKKSFDYSKPLDKKSEKYMSMQSRMGDDEGNENQSVFDISNAGFISVLPQREGKKYTYEANFYSSEKRKSWTFNPIEEGKFTQAQYLGANDSVAFLEVLAKERLMSKETSSSLVGISLTNGKKIFEIPTEDKGYLMYPMNVSTLKNGTSILMGPYFDKEDRVLQDKSLGLGVWAMNNEGKIVASKYISWSSDISKYLKMDQKGRIENLGYVYFHSLLQTDDGKVFAIGEGYKKTASALGIATTVLSGSTSGGISTAKMKVTDMVMLQLNSQFALENATIYDKYNNNVELPSGYEFMNPHTLALLLKSFGSFDYAFTQVGKNHSSFITGYTDFEKSKDYKGLTFNSISYYDGKVTTDKINLKTKATDLRVMPGKPGSVLIIEYFKKDKRLDLRLEKLN